MNKITIESQSISDNAITLYYAMKVVQQGKISCSKGKECYCYVTKFSNGVAVYARITKAGNHVLRVEQEI